jgi:DNA polymerase III delta subunit
LIDRGQNSLSELARAIGRPDWQLKNLPRQARGYTSEALVAALKLAAATEEEMKTSRDARLAFERWVVQVCA